LIARSPIFGSKELTRDRPLRIGKTDDHIVVRVGPWTIASEIKTGVRFPDVERILPGPGSVATRLRLDPDDARFLLDALGRLPGADVLNGPATLDLNGRVAVRARASDQGSITELILTRSSYTGTPVRISANRVFLARAVRLGLAHVEISDAESPVVVRDRHRVLCFQPLDKESAIPPSDDVTRVESTSSGSRPVSISAANDPGVSPMPSENPLAKPSLQTDGRPEAQVTTGESPSSGGLTALIQEAEALNEVLTDARARSGRLIAALRRYRRRERLVSNTLASLKALKLQDVTG